MLGRSVGLTYEQLRHLGDDPLPDGVYSSAEAAVVRYAQRSTRGLAIDASTYRALTEHSATPQIIDICLNVGLSQITNRFNATFLPDRSMFDRYNIVSEDDLRIAAQKTTMYVDTLPAKRAPG